MKEIKVTPYLGVHDALNAIIIQEVKDVLCRVPEKRFGERFRVTDKAPLCRIVISKSGYYSPRDIGVWSISVDEDDRLNLSGGEGYDSVFPNDYNEDDTDMLDITDFNYLIEQMGGITVQSEKAKTARIKLLEAVFGIVADDDKSELLAVLYNSMTAKQKDEFLSLTE